MTNGILIVNKPTNYTSRDVVNEVSKILHTKKIGHTGTLDPIATGVLVLTIGQATKLTDMITSYEKEYIATAVLGLNTDTLDVTGKVLNNEKTNINKETIIDVLNSFIGSYDQEVPSYSAVKINGKKLYEYARNNEEVILPKRNVTIFNIELLEYAQSDQTIITFKVSVTKGTYIRSLIRDIGIKLNTYGCMQNLIRTKQGSFKIDDAYTIESIKDNNYQVISLMDILKEYFTVKVDEQLKFRIINGQILDDIYNQEFVLFIDEKPLALYKKIDDKLKPFKMFL